MGILSRLNLGGMMGNAGQTNGKQPFPRTLNYADFQSNTEVSLKAGEFNVLGDYVVPFQNEIAWGTGKETIPDTLGFIYIDLHDNTATTAVQVEGLVRLVQKNANDAGDKIVFEERTEMLRGSKTDKKQKIALPEKVEYPRVGAQSKLVVEIKPDSDVTVDSSPDSGETVMLLPVTVYQ